LKIFVPTGIFHPEVGGPATYLREILPVFLSRGWDVRVLTFGDGALDGYGHSLTRIPRRALPLRYWDYARASRPLLGWAELIYIMGPGLPVWGGRHAPRVMKIVGDTAWERAVRKNWVSPKQDIDAFQVQRFNHPMIEMDKSARSREAKSMDAVIVPSLYLKQMVVGWGASPEKVHVVYNALPPHDDTVSITLAQSRTVLGLPQDVPLLLTAARLTAWKGVQYLIPALRAVPNVRLLVAGNGEMLPALRALASELGVADRVDFLGSVPHERMPLYLRAVDYLALYSGYEGLSHTLLEALREGTPVIASDKGGNPEVVQHGGNGLLVPYVDVDALSGVLRDAFAPGQREKLAAQSSMGMDRFTFQSMVHGTMAVLEQVMRR